LYTHIYKSDYGKIMRQEGPWRLDHGKLTLGAFVHSTALRKHQAYYPGKDYSADEKARVERFPGRVRLIIDEYADQYFSLYR